MPAVNANRLLFCTLLAETLLLAGVAHYSDFSQPGAATRFALCGVAAGVAQWLAVRAYLRVTLAPRTAATLFWVVAIALRVLMLPTEPGDDFWRYRWEGTIQLHRINPYLHAPDSAAVAHLHDADWDRVNHKDYPAIYPPAAELLFAVLAAAHVSPVGWKLIFGLADIGVIVMLRRLLSWKNPASADASMRGAAWYAWNPLAIYVFAGGGHYDSLMLLALVAAIWTLDRSCAMRPDLAVVQPPSTATALAVSSLTFAWVSTLWLGLAIALKLVPAVLLPVWFFALGWRRSLILLPFALAMLPVSACIYGFPHTPIFKTLKDFAYVTRLNDAFWWLVEAILHNNPEQKNGVYQQAMFVVCGALAIYFRDDWRRGLLWILGALLLLSPVMHPWYLVWILPFAVWRAESSTENEYSPRAWLILAASMFGYFVLWDVNRTSAPWQEPIWLRLAIYLPPCIYLFHRRIALSRAKFANNPEPA